MPALPNGGQFCSPGDIWRCLETFWLSQAGKGGGTGTQWAVSRVRHRTTPHRDIPARWPWSEGGKPCFVRVLPLSLYRAMGCPLKSHQPLSQQVAGTTGWGWGLVIEYLSHSDPQGLGWGQNWHFCRFQDGDRWAFSPPSAPCSVLYLRCDLSHLGSCLLHWTLSRLHLLPTLSL